MPRSPPAGKYFCTIFVFTKNSAVSWASESKKTRLLYSDRPIGKVKIAGCGSVWRCSLAAFCSLLGTSSGCPTPTACGSAGNPCPLQGWMREEISQTLRGAALRQLELKRGRAAQPQPKPC